MSEYPAPIYISLQAQCNGMNFAGSVYLYPTVPVTAADHPPPSDTALDMFAITGMQFGQEQGQPANGHMAPMNSGSNLALTTARRGSDQQAKASNSRQPQPRKAPVRKRKAVAGPSGDPIPVAPAQISPPAVSTAPEGTAAPAESSSMAEARATSEKQQDSDGPVTEERAREKARLRKRSQRARERERSEADALELIRLEVEERARAAKMVPAVDDETATAEKREKARERKRMQRERDREKKEHDSRKAEEERLGMILGGGMGGMPMSDSQSYLPREGGAT